MSYSENGPVSGTDPPPDSRAPVRVRNPWGQGNRLRDEILVAASRLLGELGGADGLTVRGVARQAGIAPAGIYAHFADKNALVDAVVDHEYERLVRLLRAADGPSPIATLRTKLRTFCRYAMDNPGLYRLLFGRVSRRDAGGAGSLLEAFTVALRSCEQAGHRLRLPAERAAMVLIIGTHGRAAIQQDRSEVGRIDVVLEFAEELVGLIFEDGVDQE